MAERTDESDDFLDDQIAAAVEPYRALLGDRLVADARQVLADLLSTHPLLRALHRRLRRDSRA